MPSRKINFPSVPDGRAVFVFLILFCSFSMMMFAGPRGGIPPGGGDVHLRIVVLDADLRAPMELVSVVLRRGRAVVAEKVTGSTGAAQFIDIHEGWYTITAHFIGYHDRVDSLLVDDAHSLDTIWLHSIDQSEVLVIGEHELSTATFDLSSGSQVFESETYHAAPTTQMTNLVQQSLMGAARAPTGEVHIRGQHGEFTYYVDGIPVPLGVFGGLNDIVDPHLIDRAVFYTGGFPAEFGGQTAAIIDIQNRVPTGAFHLDASMYGGSYLVFHPDDSLGSRVGSLRDLNSNGQALSLSGHAGKFGYFLSGSRQETDRRIDPPVERLFNDHGQDYFLYGKFDYQLSDYDYVTMNLNFSTTQTEVPYDSSEQIMNDMQRTTNQFQTLSLYHTFSEEKNAETSLFAGLYAREGGLVYTPGPEDPPSFEFAGDTASRYVLGENRSFTTLGTRVKFDQRLLHEFLYSAGFTFSATNGTENFTSRDSAGAAGPDVNGSFAGSDFGVFAQSEIHPWEWTTIDAGLRYDQHIAPDLPLQHQISPRVKWTVMFDQTNSAYLYYGKLFMPNNIEGLRTLASNITSSGSPTLPERDDLYEAVFMRSFDFGVRAKAAFFYKYASPGVDDQTVGSSAVKTPVNIDKVYTRGIELGLSYSEPSSPVTAYLNTSLIHAYGTGAITGGFLPIDSDGPGTDLDHDQRLSAVASINYQPQGWFVTVTAIYGSGLTNGDPTGTPYGTGLFDFNTFAHTSPSTIVNISGGHSFPAGNGMSLEPSVYITNLFDDDHLIKGAYFSAASFEERRNLTFKLSLHL
ncbi:MAG TPA: TonB-dependent receptor [Bacteroidota bacterium]|nr:TonB-dependent receptor [Bacteroidota bacterium]